MSVTQAPKLPLSIHVCHQITFDDINISGQALMNSGVDSLGMERLHSGGQCLGAKRMRRRFLSHTHASAIHPPFTTSAVQ